MNAELREKLYLPWKQLVEPSLAGFLYKMLLLKLVAAVRMRHQG